ncbi:hypothetical protein CANTEDRAFT_113600 [Yamadazyma tenuis ATCC 10573]|uniref:Rab-GAP TBC domain-containing protein n=1 Tax=Candida tenuis (strain ATCC 10573 / BCRC 21748 / CBS 615 / JCM 9827 / NBRC 10315 / NRRL Y-1498 / VKM Y-70) TaxID=590646 RepID=G3B0Y7_CANTC|nr:uncharacterized protein CANTEDRAFT_113600 [Yamadazyma tenuis ATCC 10573]EGV65143.1 hypothetical protein CANTEDRAFT_113600 [Yamadazyma tenuis ATCC 10573]
MSQFDQTELADSSFSEASPDRLSFKSAKSSTASSLIADYTGSRSKKDKVKPSFNYDLDVFKLCQKYLDEKNHHGLALIARQRGLPPFLRFKIWPVLLKYHPYVVKPSIQPDNEKKDSQITEEELRQMIKKDLNKYLIRLQYSRGGSINNQPKSRVEKQIFETLENSVVKFFLKWGKILKYDGALTWIALGLAEWFPPIAKTHWVLVGRDLSSTNNNSVKDMFTDYSNYMENIPELKSYLDKLVDDETISTMSFHDVYERLVLVLLHCPSNKLQSPGHRSKWSSNMLNNETLLNLPANGCSIEERVTFFIYIFKKLLPELAHYFSEEQILNKFGSNDDEWLIWWLKYCGSKVWSRLDRGKIWDLLLGFKFKTPGKDYNEQLRLDANLLSKLGNTDIFWSLSLDTFNSNSFINLANLNVSQEIYANEVEIPFPKVNPHVQLVFIAVALLKSKENTLIELDQHEIRQYLSRLPTNSYNLTNKYHIFKQKDPSGSLSVSPDLHNNMITNDSQENHSIDFMDNIINEAGELWRKWLWLENEQ